MKRNLLLFFLFIVFAGSFLQSQTLSGELKRWHKVTLDFVGPQTSETATPNPFTAYRLTVTFVHRDSGLTRVVPGYYAACGDGEDTSCTSGNIWRVHFVPGRLGLWNWSVSFTSGIDVFLLDSGVSAGFMDGLQGSFTILESDKSGRDLRSPQKGKLKYVGEHYLRFSGTDPVSPNGDWFFKAGADAPENTLNYQDFDDMPNRNFRRKSWAPHLQDYQDNDASGYTWADGKGKALLGVVNYLSTKGLNTFSFLTFALGGDDQNVFPHLLKSTVEAYEALPAITSANKIEMRKFHWDNGVHKDRFDVSKLAQWEKIFDYADKKGMYMHIKLFESENLYLMDVEGDFGRERTIYLRELIARFGHHLAISWNISEELTLQGTTIPDMITYMENHDPYENHLILHSFPRQQNNIYTPFLGEQSAISGASMQVNKDEVHELMKEWLQKSSDAGKKWSVTNDEQGPQNIGIDIDNKDNKADRAQVLWGTYLAGGTGVEYFYGSGTGITDLNAQDHRSRDLKYTQAAHALYFMETYLADVILNMKNEDELTADDSDYVFAQQGERYVIYRLEGGAEPIALPNGNEHYEVQWYNPRIGGALTFPEPLGMHLEAPDTEDWVALIRKKNPLNTIPLETEIHQDIRLYPNPATHQFFIEGIGIKGSHIKCYTISGRIIHDFFAKTNKVSRDISGFGSGYYMISLQEEGTSKIHYYPMIIK